MSTINRRHMLLGLAAASTAAATVVGAEAEASVTENPKLLKLAEELPAIVAAYHAAQNKAEKVARYWRGQVWAPDELTVPGIAHEIDNHNQPGRCERTVIGGYLWRVGDKFPRRIVVEAWSVYADLLKAKRQLRKAFKEGRLADCLVLEDEVGRLDKLYDVASTYERKHREVTAEAKADYGKYWPVANDLRDALEKHVAAIMDQPDRTMEGLVIKAQALAEWGRLKKPHKLAFTYGQNWHGQIAASILRHAGGANV